MLLNLKYVECPHCKKWFSTTELVSYSNFGNNSECWSDGKCTNSNFSEYSFMPFSKCNNCNNFFWFENCRQLDDYKIHEYIKHENSSKLDKEIPEETSKLAAVFLKENREKYLKSETMDLNYPPPIYWNDIPVSFINDFLKILKSKNLSVDNEIYIRIQLWQHINDLIRYTKYKSIKQSIKSIKNRRLYRKFTNFHTNNIKKLSELIEKSEEKFDKFTLLVELHRETGNFTKAKSLIENADSSTLHYNKEFAAVSKKLIKKKKTKLFKI